MSFYSPAELLRRLLDTGASFSLHQLQRELNLGDRQVRRLLDQLRQNGIPIEEHRQGKHKHVSLPADRQRVPVPDLRFDAEELRALTIAAKASRSVLVGTPHFGALKRAFHKLLEHARPVTYVFDLDEPTQEWHFDEDPADQISLDCFRAIETAMDERQSIRVDYLTAQNGQFTCGRKLDPYFFAKRQRAWMLVAHCHRRNEIRTFSVSGISRVELCAGEPFTVPSGFDADQYFRASLGAFASGDIIELRLLVEPQQALFFKKRLYHPTQQIEEEHPDGRLVVTYELEGFEEIRSFCQGWGVGITVLEPIELRQRLRDEARLLLERYQ